MAMYRKNPQLYDLDYDGHCCPSEHGDDTYCQTFSVGIFQWISKTSGNGMKRSRVLKRIHGETSLSSDVYKRAREWIEENQDKYR